MYVESNKIAIRVEFIVIGNGSTFVDTLLFFWGVGVKTHYQYQTNKQMGI